jgi:hypothetical protein
MSHHTAQPIDRASWQMLDAAYRRTIFRAELAVGVIDIRVDASTPALDELLAAYGTSSWAFVTAWNPYSESTPQENPARQRKLLEQLAREGRCCFPGRGIPDDASWQPEESFLVLDLPRHEAEALGRELQQNAIVVGVRGGPAELVWCRAVASPSPPLNSDASAIPRTRASTLESLLVRAHEQMRHTFPTAGIIAGGQPAEPWTDSRIRIPRATDRARRDYDLRFIAETVTCFAPHAEDFEVVVVPTNETQVVHANGIRNHDRYDLYRAMLSAGEPVPPIYVERLGARFYIRDGNHRTFAARAVGVPCLIGLLAR